MAALTLALLALAAQSPAAADDGPDFALEVRPLLARRCFACHGNDEETREAGLRLDLREEAMRDRDGFAALVPGDLEESELWARVTDEFDPMPPEHAGAPLDEDELSILRRWIESGAEYAPHWAFVAPERPDPPLEGTGEGHPIDAFLRAALLERGLDLSEPANDHALLRRLSLDLTGLAPTPEEARDYAASTDPAKFEKAVERLLGSDAYSERWAAVWLDLARYADSAGHGSDPLRTIWRYRDWVIEAFDRNLPFDEFTVQQLAGDLVPDASTDTRLATAFHRNTMTNTEGGTDDEEFRVLAVKDRVNTTMEVWMGLTAGCAECHSHKYDPISQVEYYELFDLFNQTADTDRNDDRPRLSTPTRMQRAEHERLTAELANVRARLDRPLDTDEETWAELEAGLRASAASSAWWSDVLVDVVAPEEDLPRRLGDDSVLITGSPASATRVATLSATDAAPTALRVDALSHPSLPRGGPGRNSASGNFVLTDLAVRAIDPEARPLHARRVRIELPGSKRILSLAEVEVFDASGARAEGVESVEQSSTAYGGPAERAVDGETSGAYEENSVTHTATEDDPWWAVTFEGDVEVASVRVWSRTDGRLAERLHGFRVVLEDATGAALWRSGRLRAPTDFADVGPSVGEPLQLIATSATHEQPGFEARRAVDGYRNDRDGWAVGGGEGRDQAAVFALPELSGPRVLQVTMQHAWGTDHVLGRFRLAVASTAEPPVALASATVEALAVADGGRTDEERALVRAAIRARDPRVAALEREAGDLEERIASLGVVTTPVMEELAAEERRATHVMVRGNFLQPGEQVHAAVPAAFPPLPEDAPADRLALARWLVSEENPLTARVAVNRVWSRLFGRGIVATEGDFGSQGAQPTHPELLDWLAVEFRESGWDHRALLRTIVTSRAYRQSSRVHATSLENDPDAVWLSRYPRQRLEAEMVRDVALQAAGLLSTKRFGPSVYPPQPEGLWQAAFNGQRNWKESEGEDRYRRGLYVFLRRTIPYPMLATFDAPSRETCTVCRVPTNTPLQAFVTLNDPVFHEAAQALGRAVASDDQLAAQQASDGSVEADLAWRGDLRKGVEALLWRVLARTPSDEHVRTLVNLYIDARGDFARDPDAARRFAGLEGGSSGEAASAAAWTLVASAALNMDAVLTKE
ncbi:MAG: DUF1553 domain-containing protein [Planctomycetota bacterium]